MNLCKGTKKHFLILEIHEARALYNAALLVLIIRIRKLNVLLVHGIHDHSGIFLQVRLEEVSLFRGLIHAACRMGKQPSDLKFIGTPAVKRLRIVPDGNDDRHAKTKRCRQRTEIRPVHKGAQDIRLYFLQEFPEIFDPQAELDPAALLLVLRLQSDIDMVHPGIQPELILVDPLHGHIDVIAFFRKLVRKIGDHALRAPMHQAVQVKCNFLHVSLFPFFPPSSFGSSIAAWISSR